MGWEGSSLSHCRPPPAAAGLRRLMSQAPAPGPPPKVGFAQLALYRQPVRSKDNVCNRQSVGTLRAGGVSKGENGMNQEDGEMHASQLMQGLLRTGLSYVGNAACNNVMTFCRKKRKTKR
ncbi:uncharacterized protein LOC118518598 isoform X3 [Halichoerus grypus]